VEQNLGWVVHARHRTKVQADQLHVFPASGGPGAAAAAGVLAALPQEVAAVLLR
jgi:hypothetical protein